MKELQEKIEKFNEERDWDQFHSPENLAKSISIEAGELLECFQWNNEYDLEEVKEELADVLNYCIQMANKLGVDPKQIILDKMEKTAKKYPIEKAKGKSTKYNKLQAINIYFIYCEKLSSRKINVKIKQLGLKIYSLNDSQRDYIK